MLSLFLELRALLPNAIVGAITRESMRKALATGIQGRQVLDFLKWHAHPVVRRRSPVVPENIADQVSGYARVPACMHRAQQTVRIAPTKEVIGEGEGAGLCRRNHSQLRGLMAPSCEKVAW